MKKVASRKRTVYPFQMAEAFAALDRRLTCLRIQASMHVNPLGYAFHTEGHDSKAVEENRKISQAIAVVAKQLHLPDDWARHMSMLFPSELFKHSYPDRGRVPFALAAMGGTALEVSPARPEELLSLLLFFAEDGFDLPISISRIADAAGCHTAKQVVSVYENGFADYPLPIRVLRSLASLMEQ